MGLWSQVLKLNHSLPSVLNEVGVTDSGQNTDDVCEVRWEQRRVEGRRK